MPNYNLISVEKPHLRSPNCSLGRQVISMLGAVPQLARAARAKDEARVMEGYLKVQYSAVQYNTVHYSTVQ